MRFSNSVVVRAIIFTISVYFLFCGCGSDTTEPEGSPAGSIQLFPNPEGINASWTLAGSRNFVVAGSGDSTIHELAPGEYTVTWGDLPGWILPASESSLLGSGGELVFECTYQLDGFIYLPAGDFAMGEPPGGIEQDTKPLHHVSLTHGFSMQLTEVTNIQYMELVQWAYDQGLVTASATSVLDALDGSNLELLDLDDDDCDISFNWGVFACENPNRPVSEVSWFGAAAYCDWLCLRAGFNRPYDHSNWRCNSDSPYTMIGFRLPTEAEWEFACRAGTDTRFNTGDCICAITEANYDGHNPALGCSTGPLIGHSVDVGSYLSNAWGLFDMHGNLDEWCNDWYDDEYYQSSPEQDPPGPTYGSLRVARGGNYYTAAYNSRSAKRKETSPDTWSQQIGFRPIFADQ